MLINVILLYTGSDIEKNYTITVHYNNMFIYVYVNNVLLLEKCTYSLHINYSYILDSFSMVCFWES